MILSLKLKIFLLEDSFEVDFVQALSFETIFPDKLYDIFWNLTLDELLDALSPLYFWLHNFDRYFKGEYSLALLALFEYDISSHFFYDVMATCKAHSDIKVAHFLKILFNLELLKRDEEHILSVLTYTYPCINHLSFKDIVDGWVLFLAA